MSNYKIDLFAVNLGYPINIHAVLRDFLLSNKIIKSVLGISNLSNIKSNREDNRTSDFQMDIKIPFEDDLIKEAFDYWYDHYFDSVNYHNLNKLVKAYGTAHFVFAFIKDNEIVEFYHAEDVCPSGYGEINTRFGDSFKILTVPFKCNLKEIPPDDKFYNRLYENRSKFLQST